MAKLLLISLIVFAFNIPFGYWRANVRKFSFQWVLAIHIPVPFIIALRIFSGVGFAWFTYVFVITSYSIHYTKLYESLENVIQLYFELRKELYPGTVVFNEKVKEKTIEFFNGIKKKKTAI